MKIKIVILAGGGGTRLWPLSNKIKEKQFLPLSKNGESLLRSTYRRVQSVTDDIYIACPKDMEDKIRDHMEIPVHIITEPARRDTGPAVTRLAWRFKDDDIVATVHADHIFDSEKKFQDALIGAIEKTNQNNQITLIGIKPNEANFNLDYFKMVNGNVLEFIMRDRKDDIVNGINNNSVFWNIGTFVFRVREMKKMVRDLHPIIATAHDNGSDNAYDKLTKIAFDPLILVPMSKQGKLNGVVLDTKWCDIGTWSSIYNELKNNGNNVIIGKNIKYDNVNNSVIVNDSKRNISICDVNKKVIVATDDDMFFCDLETANDRAKEFSNK